METHSSLVLQYTGFSGEEITLRTICEDEGNILVSLEDMVHVLAIENKKLSVKHGKQGLGDLVNATAAVLDEDEVKRVFTSDGKRTELFVTQPGMYRVVSRDNSPACKKFQRWLFHDVLPSIHKHGTYPPPLASKDSGLKSLAKTLIQNTELVLKEIEEREKLEAMVIEKFDITDQQLRLMNDRIKKFEYISSEAFADAALICEREQHEVDVKIVLAWCYKICLEKNIETRCSFESPSIRLYPRAVIDEAISFARETRSS